MGMGQNLEIINFNGMILHNCLILVKMAPNPENVVKWVKVKTYCHGIKPSSFGVRYQGFIHRGHTFAEIQLCEVTQALKEAVAELAGATWALKGASQVGKPSGNATVNGGKPPFFYR